MKPKRLQRKRSKGFRLDEICNNPNGWVYVGRPTKWGNPFVVGKVVKLVPIEAIFVCGTNMELYDKLREGFLIGTLEMSLKLYRNFIGSFEKKKFKELKGKDLACFCSLDQKCHADYLLKRAN